MVRCLLPFLELVHSGGAFENRCKYVPVRLLSAIHGSKHFRKLHQSGLSNIGVWIPSQQINLGDSYHNSLTVGLGVGFQNCAEPWMAEPKRHMDVPKERVLEAHPQTNHPPEPEAS